MDNARVSESGNSKSSYDIPVATEELLDIAIKGKGLSMTSVEPSYDNLKII